MNLFYNLGISLYSAAVGIAATRNNKARLMKAGQAQTFGILAEKVDTSASYIWIHVSSLGEFEQGRPLMEMIKSIRRKRRFCSRSSLRLAMRCARTILSPMWCAICRWTSRRSCAVSLTR